MVGYPPNLELTDPIFTQDKYGYYIPGVSNPTLKIDRTVDGKLNRNIKEHILM